MLSVLIFLVVVTMLGGIVMIMAGCTAGTPAVSVPVAQPIYMYTLTGLIDQTPFTGVALGSATTSHTITVTSLQDVNVFTIQSCARDVPQFDIIKQGWIAQNRSYQFTYQMDPGFEDTGDCPLRICAFTKDTGVPPSACALIDFKNSKYTMVGENRCNATDGIATGTAICHNSVGRLGGYFFSELMEVAPAPVSASPNMPTVPIIRQCQGQFVDDPAHPSATEGMHWQYSMPHQECVVYFMQRSKPHKIAKLLLSPWTTFQYPGSTN